MRRINVNILIYFLMVLLKYIAANYDSQWLCTAPEANFSELCSKVIKLPAYSGRYSVKQENRSKDCKEYDFYLPIDNFYNTSEHRVTARGCPTVPKLFLSVGKTIYAASVYQAVGSGLEQIGEVASLISLGYIERGDTGTFLEQRSEKSVNRMSSFQFIELCEEILKTSKFNTYSLKESSESLTDSKEYDVFEFDERGRPVIDKVYARSCFTNPQLFVSDGPKNYSVFLYHSTEKGLLRINKAERLVKLGYTSHEDDESPPLSHLESIFLMDVFKFLDLCEEILTLQDFQTYSTDQHHIPEVDVKKYNVYLPAVGRVIARGCPTEPELFLSYGSAEHSFIVSIPMDGGLVKIDEVHRLIDLGYTDSASTSSNSLLAPPDSESILSMSELEFQLLCDEITLQLPFAVRTNATSRVCEERNVYLIGNANNIVGRAKARACPTEPELFLTNGREKYSAYVYMEIPQGLMRIYETKKLRALGYRETETEPVNPTD